VIPEARGVIQDRARLAHLRDGDKRCFRKRLFTGVDGNRRQELPIQLSLQQVRPSHSASAKQAQALLNAPDASTDKALPDRKILAVLLGCGLRHSEVAALTFKHIQQRDAGELWILVGKHGRVRVVAAFLPKPP
jgi:integrase